MTFVNGSVKVGKIAMMVHTVDFLLLRSDLIFFPINSQLIVKRILRKAKNTLFCTYKLIQSIWSTIWHFLSRILNKPIV